MGDNYYQAVVPLWFIWMTLKELGIVTKIPKGWSSPKNKVRRQAYNSWTMMLHRCYDSKQNRYDRYGQRGIIVCDRWHNFGSFIVDMGLPPTSGHSIDRVNGDGNYEPSNCRWATRTEQLRNYSRNHLITYKGKTKCLTEWSEILGFSGKVLNDRIIKLKWNIEKAFTTKVMTPKEVGVYNRLYFANKRKSRLGAAK